VDLTFSPAEEAFRLEARTWLEANVPREPLPSGDTAEGFALHRHWEKRLFEARWAVVSWPKAYGGREASLVEWLLFNVTEDELRARGRKPLRGREANTTRPARDHRSLSPEFHHSPLSIASASHARCSWP